MRRAVILTGAMLMLAACGPRDLLGDVRITDCRQADREVSFTVEVTNSSERERDYSIELEFRDERGFPAGAGLTFVPDAPPGETVTGAGTGAVVDGVQLQQCTVKAVG